VETANLLMKRDKQIRNPSRFRQSTTKTGLKLGLKTFSLMMGSSVLPWMKKANNPFLSVEI
jgi:hypothetical protein